MSDEFDEDIGNARPYGARNYALDGWGYCEVQSIDKAKKTSAGNKRFEILCRVLYHEPAEAGGPTHKLGDVINVGAKRDGHDGTKPYQRDNDLGRINAWSRAIMQPNFLAADASKGDFTKAFNKICSPTQNARGVVVKFTVKKVSKNFREVTFEPVVPQTAEQVKERRAAQDRGVKPAPFTPPGASAPLVSSSPPPVETKTEAAAPPPANTGGGSALDALGL